MKQWETDFGDLGAGLAMRRIGFSDQQIVDVLGYLPPLDMSPERIASATEEIRSRRKARRALRA